MALASERAQDRWFCCSRRAPKVASRQAGLPDLLPIPGEADDKPSEAVEKAVFQEAEEEPTAPAESEGKQIPPIRPDASDEGSSGYFEKTDSSGSGSLVSNPCFWKPRKLHSESSAASVTSSDYWKKEAQKAELERLTAQVPKTENGEPTSVGSINHPNGCYPCVFFVRPSGCIRGVQCEGCHFPHQVNVKKNLSVQRAACFGPPVGSYKNRKA
mmetsp:Transcript_57305/g.134050  ORF Transcript_57305/g.134050 Transcript_57305/m.134050 type:complete len:214 (-) Transcript_57305:221-862(-)